MTKKTKEPTAAEMTAKFTEEQLRDVTDYMLEKGVRWKSELNLDWMHARARVRGEHSAPLQQIRNTYGPDWLNKVTTAIIQAEVGARGLTRETTARDALAKEASK